MKGVVDVSSDRVPPGPVQTRIHVIAGGPCSGKTTLVTGLREAGFATAFETAEQLLIAGIEAGRTAEEIRHDPVAWQRRVLHADFELFDGMRDRFVFTDTSVIESCVFARMAGLAIGPNLEAWMRRFRYSSVFFLEPLEAYRQTSIRLEDQQTAREIGHQVLQAYGEFGYDPVSIPALPAAARLKMVLESPLEGADRAGMA